ncbi:hypothetical protein BCR32DRAFT_328227 [Anaeromyces robustus]|uniref:Uncharacterized protein n=1 Tax=Anaeromyces robustus TaxID=1754192 RepID=A0A1Y1X0A9_9FUNG|nr:hypothetical protein BCR32DRAFT_328227 [Anaeromyces robustus]|eukprot:ORX79173.1 hypothetical protein BCR32DRAFT_328227 [Anaeromyces robustus]
MAFLLLPIALIAWPILVAFSSILFGIIYSIFSPIQKTFVDDISLFFGGFVEPFEDLWHYICKFWKFNYHSYFAYLFEIEERRVDEPFDINIIQIIIGLLLACYGSVVGIIIFVPLWLIKFIPLTIRLYYILINLYIKEFSLTEKLLFSIFFLVAMVLIPVIGVSSILFFIGTALFGGIMCAIEGYKYNNIRGLISIWFIIYYIDVSTNYFIYRKDYSCFPDCEDTYKYKRKEKKVKSSEENNKLNNENNFDSSNKEKNPSSNIIIIDEKPETNKENISINIEDETPETHQENTSINIKDEKPETDKENISTNIEDEKPETHQKNTSITIEDEKPETHQENTSINIEDEKPKI